MNARKGGGDVGIVVTHYRNRDDLFTNLTSIAQFGGARVAEVWIADSQAIAGVRDFVHELLPEARYLPFRRNVGYAALVNMGAAASSTPYIMVLNADVSLTPGCVEALASELDRTPDIGAISPQLRYADDSPQHSTFAFHRPSTVLYRRTILGRSRWGRRELERFMGVDCSAMGAATGEPVDVDWTLGAALMIRRETFDEVGPLDERYFLYFEDVDWCLRAWRAGWRCSYLRTAICIHGYARASANGGVAAVLTNPLTRRHVRSAVRFFRLYGLRPSRPPIVRRPRATMPDEITLMAEPRLLRPRDRIGGIGT